ncbi:MAG TPA: hypothetical protein VLG67_00165 [Candidatus Saccharimonadales bacterium]|nr:hypothetical protein [Candidatus Saccharimonadales bacterium]
MAERDRGLLQEFGRRNVGMDVDNDFFALREREFEFLREIGAIEAITAQASELKRNIKDVKLGIANPSVREPLNVVLSWGEHTPDFERRPYLRAWNTVIIGTVKDGADLRLTINGSRVDQAEDLNMLLTAAIKNPLKRKFEDAKSRHFVKPDQMENQNLFASERQMRGRTKIKIGRPRRAR